MDDECGWPGENCHRSENALGKSEEGHEFNRSKISMKIFEIRDSYYEATGKVSDIVRQLGLAGIAIIWIFRSGTDTGGIPYSHTLKVPLGLFVVSLVFDLLQYAYKSLIWGILNWHYFRKHGENGVEVEISGKWNMPALMLFWSKTIIAVVAYIYLFGFIYHQL
jgi:hypothetical protein